MKFISLILTLLLAGTGILAAQPPTAERRHGKGYFNSRAEVIAPSDTIAVIDMWPVYVFNKPADMRQYQRLVRNVKKVYPIAKEARHKLSEMEAHILTLRRSQQQAYIKQMEKEIQREYTPIIRKLTFSQGKILIKLIDRETDRTSYDIVRQLRGKFSAAMWQGVAKIFGANLKDRYDKEGEDKVIEQIILLYEAGLI